MDNAMTPGLVQDANSAKTLVLGDNKPGINLWPFLGLANSALSGYFAYRSSKKQNELMKEIAQKQMDFQERMSSTAYQRSIQDLKKAGLNPLLAATHGASSPAGAGYSPGNPTTAGISSAADAFRTTLELKNMDAQNKRLYAEIQNINASTAKGLLDAYVTTKQIKREFSTFGEFLYWFGKSAKALGQLGKSFDPLRLYSKDLGNMW